MKSIILENNVHTELKSFCDTNGFKINKLANNIILKYIENENRKMHDLQFGNERSNKRISLKKET